MLQEKLGNKVDSKSICPPWLVRHAAHVLSRFVKRDVGRSAWARLSGKNATARWRRWVRQLEPRRATGRFLGRTDESDEVIVGTAVKIEFARSFRRRTRDKQWQRDAFTGHS